MSRRRRRFHHEGVYFADTSGLRAALIDAGQLLLCLEALLSHRGLLDVELVPRRASGRYVQPAVSVREAIEAMHSAAEVFHRSASVVERAWQAMEQCGVMLDAAEAVGDEQAAARWMLTYDVCARLAYDESPVRRDVLTLARATLRACEREARGKANRSGGGSGGKGEVGSDCDGAVSGAGSGA